MYKIFDRDEDEFVSRQCFSRSRKSSWYVPERFETKEDAIKHINQYIIPERYLFVEDNCK